MFPKSTFQYQSSNKSMRGYSGFGWLKGFHRNGSFIYDSDTSIKRYKSNSNRYSSQSSDTYTDGLRIRAKRAEHNLIRSNDQDDIIRAEFEDAAHIKTPSDIENDSATIVAENYGIVGVTNDLPDPTKGAGTLDFGCLRANEDQSSYNAEKTNIPLARSPKLSYFVPNKTFTRIPNKGKGTSGSGHIGGKRHKVRFWRNKRDNNVHEEFSVNDNHFNQDSILIPDQSFTKKHHFRRWLNRNTDEIAAVNYFEEPLHRVKYVASEAASAASIRSHARAAIKAGSTAAAAYARVALEGLNPDISNITRIATINEACENVAKTSLGSRMENADYLKLLSLLDQHLNSKKPEWSLSSKSLCRHQDEPEKSSGFLNISIKQEDESLYNKENSQLVTSLKILPKNSSEIKRPLLKADDNIEQSTPSLLPKNVITEKIILQANGETERSLIQLAVSDDSARNDYDSKEHLDELYDPFKSELFEDEDFKGSRFILFSSAESASDVDDDDSRQKNETELSLLENVYCYADSEDGIWPQVASTRRHRLLLQMESLAPRSLLLESLTKDC